jgi:hypothetical protein
MFGLRLWAVRLVVRGPLGGVLCIMLTVMDCLLGVLGFTMGPSGWGLPCCLFRGV